MSLISLFKKTYIPLNSIEVSASALKHNYEYLHTSSGLAIAPVIKSNAYGHGLISAAKILDTFDAPFFCVDSIYEAYELLKAKIKTPILIMGYVSPQNLAIKRLPFSFAVSTKEMLGTLRKYQPDARIHIFIDTGIHREGIPIDEVSNLVKFLKTKNIPVEGLMGHFAASDNLSSLTQEQVLNFQRAQALFLAAGIQPKWIHHANASGVLNYKNYKGKIGNVARTGIALYGIDPERKNIHLQPALTFNSTLVQIKELPNGASSGYDFTFTAKKLMKIGVVAAGYNDGVDRRLSNKGCTKIGDTYCPIIGRVSMNLTMIDITGVKNPKVGDKVEIFSSNPKDKNSISAAALLCGTIPYDLLVKLTTSTKRIIV